MSNRTVTCVGLPSNNRRHFSSNTRWHLLSNIGWLVFELFGRTALELRIAIIHPKTRGLTISENSCEIPGQLVSVAFVDDFMGEHFMKDIIK